MSNNETLITHLKESGVLKSPHIERAFHAIDRTDFVRPEDSENAYEDHPLPIGSGQTISQPYTAAFMLELLEPQVGQYILDVGSGSGWTTALLAHIVGKDGRIIGTEIVPELVSFGQMNLAKYNFKNAQIRETSIGTFGAPKNGPFDRILVSADAKEIPPSLVRQLTIGGIMVIPVQGTIHKITKTSETEIEIETHPGFSFVPLQQ